MIEKIDGLNISRGIERFGGENAYFEILRSYIASTTPLLDSITEIGKNSLSGYSITIHGIKGSSYGIFADPVGILAENLEKASKNGDFDFVVKNNPAFIAAAKKLINGIERTLSEITGGKIKPKKNEPEMELLQKLIAACIEYDISGAEEILAELEEYEYESGGELINWFKDSLAKGFFETIIENLSVLIRQEVQQ